MEELNKVPSSGTTFGNVVESINANFGLILTAITELEQTNKRKYLFSNEAELKATYPNPDKGDYAFVGELANAIVYKCTTAGTWTNTGEKWNVGGTIDVTAYVSPSDPVSDLTQLVATKVRMLQNKGEVFLPATSTKAVLDPDTKKVLSDELTEMRSKDENFEQHVTSQAGTNKALADNISALAKQTTDHFNTIEGGGITEDMLSDGLKESIQSSASGKGGNTFNVTDQVPLESGFYTLETAIAAVPEKNRSKGLCITFEASQGKWLTKQFIGTDTTSWDATASWEDFGGAGTVKQVTVNGEKKTPDSTGNIDITIPTVEVDETLDQESTNPVENKAIAAKLNEIEGNTLASTDVEVSDDGSTVHVSLKNKNNGEITSFDVPAGSGGGGGETSTTKIVLSAVVNNSIVKRGGSSMLTYEYDHQYSSGDEKGQSTGQKATIKVLMKLGATTIYSDTIEDVSSGSYQLDLTKYLQLGTTDIYVIASTTDPLTGNKQTKQAYTSVKAVTLSLASSFNIADCVALGGYADDETVNIPFAVSGSGTKVVTLYVDGKQRNAQTVTRSGTTNSSFNLAMTGLENGRHTIQMVAEMEASPTLTLRSDSIYFDILRGAAEAPYIGAKITSADGSIFTDDHLTPTIKAGQYEQMSFDFVAYDPATTPASMSVYRDDIKTQTVSVPRTLQTYTNRYLDQGTISMRFESGATSYNFFVEVEKSSVDIVEITDGLQLKLTASGRASSEADPAVWQYGDVATKFSGFDWTSNGWTGDALKLTNGANIEIGFKPFSSDATSTGATYEMELMCSNVTDRDGIILDCMADGVGFQMTTQEAKIRTTAGTEVSTKFAAGMSYKIAFVVSGKGGNRLLQLYVNGTLSSAIRYAATDSMIQQTPADIRVLSDDADVELRNLRIYNRALNDDEELSNYIVDRKTSDEMVVLFQKNAVMNDEGTDVDIEKLRAQGKGVMRIVGDIDLLNQTNNKKFEIPVDIYFYSPYGKQYDFVIKRCGLRIQGTSSTTYPRKNYRIYMSRSEKYGTQLFINGVLQEDFLYSFKPGARPVDIFCIKADFCDSSSTHNTGAVRIVNDVFKRCGWLTPPQAAYKGEYDVRIGVDGFPIDVFYDQNGDGTNAYLGKYNFNNEKSGSAIVYGFEGIEGFNDEATLAGQRNKCICLEFLNNSEPICLFGTADLARFDAALEFRFKPDKTWDTADPEDKAAVQRLWQWIYSCKGNPTKFQAEYQGYFINEAPFAWYLITDYLMGVDNRVKNMMLVTWDGVHWMFIPYDMDTLFGLRNDSYLKYDYTITHETFDDSIGSYAFAGHDSILWELVRACPDKLREVAETIRSNMSLDYVLQVFNEQEMGNWCERIYNKDGIFKYVTPLIEGIKTTTGTMTYDYLYALQGSRYAHRCYTIQNRFALLDSQYVCGTYRKDSFGCYFGYKFGSDNRKIKITASERYYFGYGYTSGTPHQSAVLAADKGSQVQLVLDTDLIVNDPQYIYGASRIMGLDLTDVSHAILQTLNLSNLTALTTLDISCAGTQTTLNNLIVDGCKNLRSLNMGGLQSAQLTGMDLTNNTKLETFLASDTALTGVTFAKGSPLTKAVLPATLQTLDLRYLSKLQMGGLTLEGTDNITRLVVDNCPGIDWTQLMAKCPNVRYIRITGIDEEGDGSLLRQYMEIGGVDESGGNVETCRLVGSYQLTQYIDDVEFQRYQQHYPELNIMQPPYTIVEFDDSVADDANVSNLDNETGYKYGNAYQPSGHIKSYLSQRHRVLAKVTKKATQRNVSMAGVDTVMNNLDGEMTYYPLHDDNSNYYADAKEVRDCSAAKLDSTEGDIMMLEPHHWFKGINDYLNRKHYICFSTNKTVPSISADTVQMTIDEIKLSKGGWREGYKLTANKPTLSESYVADTNYAVIKVDVEGYSRVRFPAVPGTNMICSLFLAEDGSVISNVLVPTINLSFERGQYIISDIPDGAKTLCATVWKNTPGEKVVLSNSDKIEDMEPDWVEIDEYLCGVVGSTVVGDKLRACVSGGSTTANMAWSDFHYYSVLRGMQQIDFGMHSDIANLFYMKYGRRNSQEQCGAGSHTNNRTTGGTMAHGIADTIGYDAAKAVNASVTNSIVDNGVHQYAWYLEGDEESGATTVKQVNNICCCGYEDIYGHKYDMVDNCDMPNDSAHSNMLRIFMPDGNTRYIKVSSYNDIWITNVYHGQYGYVIAVGSASGSASTYYGDRYWVSGASNRVLFRGYNNANSNGGISCTNAANDASSTSAYVGSRLAFRGKIVKASSVARYKATSEVA
jgi:hypothetical protein